jgi:hypothetical protein
LTDSEASLKEIHKWVGGGVTLHLTKGPDTDVLKEIVIKLQKRVLEGAETPRILIKVRLRGDPLNEETDIRGELGVSKNRRRPYDDLPYRTSIPMDRRVQDYGRGKHHQEVGMDKHSPKSLQTTSNQGI